MGWTSRSPYASHTWSSSLAFALEGTYTTGSPAASWPGWRSGQLTVLSLIEASPPPERSRP